MNKTTTISRPAVGFFALACLLIGGVMMWRFSDEQQGWGHLSFAFVRVGVLMSALWLALPSRTREAAWANVSPRTMIGLCLAIFAIGWRPRFAIPVIIIAAILAFILKPRKNKRRRPPSQ